MACELKTEAYIPIVKNLFKLDSEKFKNFDNVVEFIVNSNIKPENKKLAVHNIAMIYQELHGLDSTMYTLGKAKDVIVLSGTEKTEEYLNLLGDLYNFKSVSFPSESAINKKVEELRAQKQIFPTQMKAFAQLVKNHVNSAKFESKEERDAFVKQQKEEIHSIITTLYSGDTNAMLIMLSFLDNAFASMESKSNYIPLDAVTEFVGMDNYLFTLKDGTMVEGVIENDLYYITNPVDNNMYTPVEKSQVVSFKLARPNSENFSTSGKHVFFNTFFNSGLSIDSVSPEDYAPLMEELSKIQGGGIEIHAVQLSTSGDDRVARIKNLANNDEAYANLKNRNHETFEFDSQKALLSSSPNGKIVSVSRPKRSENEFALVGKIKGTERSFYIYSTENLVFVNSNNETELVDLTNDAHLKELAKLSQRQDGSELTEADLHFIKKSYQAFQELKDEVRGELANALTQGKNSIDVTTQFLRRYEMSSSRATPSVKTVLSKAMKSDPQFYKTLTIVTRDDDGNVTSSTEKDIPFVFYKQYNQTTTKKVMYVATNYLAADEKIEHTDENGEKIYLTQSQYATDVLGLNTKIKEIFKKEDEALETAMANNEPIKNLIKTGRFVIKFVPDSNEVTYAIAVTNRQLEHIDFFANFASTFFLNYQSSEVTKEGIKLVNDRFTNDFRFEAPGEKLSIDFKSNPKSANLELRLAHYSTNPRKAEYTAVLAKYPYENYVAVSTDKLIAVVEKFFNEKLLNKIKEENPALKHYDLNDIIDRSSFFKTIFEILNTPDASASIKEFVANVKNAEKEFTKILVDDFSKLLNQMPEEFKKLAIEDLGITEEEFTAENLLTYKTDNETSVLRVLSGKTSDGKVSTARRLYDSSMKNVSVLTNPSRRSFTISLKENITTPAATKPEYADVVNEVKEQENKYDDSSFENSTTASEVKDGTVENTDEFDEEEGDDVSFQIFEEGVDIVTEDDTRAQASSWLASQLPQLGLSNEALKDIIDLATIDGIVIGMMKDKFIYLNDAITSRGIIYHEAFHGVFRHLMTQQERDNLIKAVMDDPTHASKFTEDAVYAFGRQRNYTENNYDALARLVAEEILADKFQKYMLKEKHGAPKTMLQKFFDMLKKLLKFFIKNRNVIESSFARINNGAYKTAVYNSGMFEGTAAFELIPIQTVQYKNVDGKMLFTKSSTLTTYEQTQLIGLINREIFNNNNESETYTQKFEKAVNTLLETVLSHEALVKQNPEKKNEIINSYHGKLISKYRFVLGGRMKGLPVYDINETGDPERNNKKTVIKIKTNEEDIENSRGEYSYERLLKLSKQAYDKADSLDIIKESDSEVVNSDEVQDVINGETQGVITDEDAVSAQDELESNDFDSTLGQKNPIDSYVRQIRRYFSGIRNDVFIPELGIMFPKVIDGNQIFTSMLKITANAKPSDIITMIGVRAEKNISDGYVQDGSDLKAVYDSISKDTGIDPVTKRPTKNHMLYNIIVDALQGVELNYLFFNIQTPETNNDDENASISQLMQAENQEFRYTIIDKVADTDSTQVRNTLLTNFVRRFKKEAASEDKKYLNARNAVIGIIDKIRLENEFLTGLKSSSVILKELVNPLYENLQILGFDVPKSLLELSLLAIQMNERGVPLPKLDEQDQLFYNVEKNFVAQTQYLEEDFFKDLRTLLISMYDSKGVPTKGFEKRLDDTTSEDIRFMTILKKASNYIAKYNPTNLPSVIKNAEGKSIYRYAKTNPLMTLSQKLNTMSLDEAISNDPYYEQVKAYLKDNPFFGALFSEDTSTDAYRKAKLYLDNFNVAMFGGVQQRVGQSIKDGKTFKGVDKRSLFDLQILSFLSRRKQNDKYGNTMSVFYRSFHQLESTQTNFLIPTIYTQFLDKKGKVKTESNHSLIVDSLVSTIKQEYNRIQREWNTRVERKQEYEKGSANRNINKYNAKLNSDGKTINTESSSLRAYNFNVLQDFFDDPRNEKYKEEFIQYAKDEENFKFEDLDLGSLKDSLEVYAEEEFQKFMGELVSEKLITETNIPFNKVDESVDEDARITTYYTSELMPKSVKTDISKNETETLSDIYAAPEGFDPNVAHPETVPVENMLYDYFMNHWKGALEVNQLMDGDIAMNVKNFQDYVKRLKKIVASGSNLKEGFHTTAVMNDIKGFVHEDYPYYGPYYSLGEIANDFNIPNNSIREALREGYVKAESGAEEIIDGVKVKWGDMMRDTFDGQSISLLMHQLDMHDALGRVDTNVIDITIAKHYRTLTEAEKNYLESKKVVNNAKKTVTAGRNVYHKDSEDYTDRLDVSRLKVEPVGEEDINEATNRVFNELHAAYREVYDLRRESHYASLANPNDPIIGINKGKIQDIFRDRIHTYYEPLPHRKMMHDILNSMEYYQIDQIMDTSASKNATKLPIDIFKYDRDDNSYIRFDLSSSRVPNEDKYLQVETSGVKEKAKHSVQSKLLLPADLSDETFRKIIRLENEKRGKVMTPSEEKSLLKINSLLKNYQISLGKSTQARLDYFKTVLREGNDFQVGKIYNMIRKSLEEQNAPSNMLKMFDLKPDGTPVFSPNLSTIRTTLEYYLISQYSNNVTDEKTAGGKNFHVSGFGHNVMVDIETNTVIRTEEVSKNPEKYNDTAKYKSRPLSVSVEIQPDGTKLYYAEVIMPKPYFENKQQEQFYMENLTKMFGTRIPTEDKRSMMVFKVVDFVESSKMNNIIVPQFVHMLSGSDFDIDSLFFRMKSYYKNGKNEYALFGDYSQYKSEKAGKFIEFIHFIKKHDDFALALKAEKQRLIDENTFELSDESQVFEILDALKFDIARDVMEFFDREQTKSDLIKEKEFTSYMFKLAADAKELFVQTKLESEQNKTDKDLSALRNQYGEEYAIIKSVKHKSIKEKRALQNRMRIINAAFEYQAALNILSEFGMPASVDAFNSNPKYNEMVSMKFQNDNLDASIGILANEAVFNYLYINQRASVEQFRNIIENRFGLKLKELTKKGNLYTPTNMVLSKVENSSSKTGLGSAAVMNKFLAVASQYNLKLDDKQKIWQFRDSKGEFKSYAEFGQLNEEDQRVISIIGNILGMFADAAKDPIPAALQLNEINISTTLAMLGVGLKPEFAFGFNFLPGIREASKAVQQAQFAISEDSAQEYVFYNNAVQTQIEELEKNNPGLIGSLKAAGIMNPLTSLRNLELYKSKIKIEFDPKKIEMENLDSLTPSQIGFKVSTDKGIELTDAQAEAVLMMYYWEQSKQTFAINRVANMTNLFKRLNPSLVAFDKQREGIEKIQSGELFSNADVLFKDEFSVFKILQNTLNDAAEQMSKILIERSEFFQNVNAQFGKYFKDPKIFANVITSYIGLRKFVKTFPGSREASSDIMKDFFAEDDAILQKSFTPEYWFTNSLERELEELQAANPKNEFLRLLRVEESDKTAVVNFEGKDYEVAERYLKILSRAKIKGDFANTISDDIYALYKGKTNESMFIRKLFYHELVRTGMMPKAGSFFQFMPVELLLPISNNIDTFINYMKNATTEDINNFEGFMSEFLGGGSQSDTYEFFDELFNQIAYAASTEKGNDKIPRFKSGSGKNRSYTELKISTGKESDRFKYATQALYNFVDTKSKTMEGITMDDMLDAKEKMITKLLDIFGKEYEESVKVRDLESVNIVDLAGDEFTMDLSSDKSDPASSLSKIFGVKYDAVTEEFEFPRMLKIGAKTFILQSTNTFSTKGKSAGEVIVNAFQGKTTFSNYGSSATYKAIPEVYSSDKFSPLAFTSKQAEQYKKYIDRTEKIMYVRPGSTAVTEAAPETPTSVAKTTQSSVSTVKPGQDTKINIYAGTGENVDLSNFAIRPFTVDSARVSENGLGTIKFKSVEQAFQYFKFDSLPFTEENVKIANAILKTTNGAELRRLGKQFQGLNRTTWDSISPRIMKDLLVASFKQNPEALDKLLATGNATLTHKFNNVEQDNGRFSKILMEVRDEFNKKTAEPITNVEEVDDDEMIGGTFVDANMLNAILGLKNGTTDTSEDEDNDSEDPLKC